MRYSKPIVAAAILHLVLAYFLSLRGGEGDGDSKKEQKPVTINIVDRKQQDETESEKTKQGKTQVKQKEKKKKIEEKDLDCKDFFYGIGIEIWYPCRVTKVFAGYPAEKNDIRVDDVIVQPECGDIIGENGTTVNLKILRGGELINKSIVRGKVCGTK